jgi:small subunit ribosomal protein S20
VGVARVSIIRGLLRKVEEAISGGDKKIAQLAFKTMQPKLMSGINAGVVHRNLVSRKLSRLSKKIKVMG